MSNSGDALWKPLGSLLVEKGLVTQEELDIALVEHERTGRRLGEVLVDLGVVSGSGVTKVLLEQLGVDLSRESGFGSGLRDQLDRRAAEADRPSDTSTPVIGDELEGPAVEAASDDGRAAEAKSDDGRAAEPEFDPAERERPIIREVSVEEPEHWRAETVARENRREVELESSDRRRIFGKRKAKQAAERKLSAAVADFERQSAALQHSLAEIRRLLGEFSPSDSQQRAAGL